MQGRGTAAEGGTGGGMLTDDGIGVLASPEPPSTRDNVVVAGSLLRADGSGEVGKPSTGRRASGGTSPFPRATVHGTPGSGGGRTDRRTADGAARPDYPVPDEPGARQVCDMGSVPLPRPVASASRSAPPP